MTGPFAHVLATTDFSPPSNQALDMAVGLARVCGARLTLLHIIESDFESSALAYGLRPVVADYAEKSEQAAMDRLEALGARIEGLDVDLLLKRGTPSVEVVRTAEQEACDVIVIGTHGQSAIRHMLFGSTVERVVRKATRPVVVVPSAPPRQR